MNDQEFLRIIEFIESTRAPFNLEIPGMSQDSDWAITSYLVTARLQEKDVSISDLIRVSGLTYGTAHRRINGLIEQGLIDVAPASPTGKSHSLRPSEKLLDAFRSLVSHVKSLVATLVGQRDDSQNSDQYYFGEPRGFIERSLPPTDLPTSHGGATRRLRFLFHDDNYFAALRNLWIDFRANAGRSEDFQLTPMQEMYETALSNGARDESEFDIITLNYPWLAEFAQKDLIAPLDIDVRELSSNLGDFHPAALECVTYADRLFGLPLYVTVESLLARRDIFEENALPYPTTLKELLAVARRLHRPKRGQYGLAWNGAKGMPIASAFMFLLNAHGGAVIAHDEPGTGIRSRRSRPQGTRCCLDEKPAHATLAFMQQLLAVSPPDTLAFDWEDSLAEFMSGHAALCYAWSMRAARLELDLQSKVKGKIKILPHPNLLGVRRSVPLGGFVLAVPRNLPPARAALAQQAIRWMTSSEAMKSSAKYDLPIAPRFSVNSDPDLKVVSMLVSFVDDMARNGLICNSMRPLTPVYTHIEEILGVEIHNALCGLTSHENALSSAHERIQAVLDSVLSQP
ncbi:extracellular solute-binding protein [Paraburkholderia sp. DHOC27]|uniref:extracellular solute-binding protein n=1 Tax=Paraburkholderia sp. DHOC27 TaxID=2303330 RepID=UPI000E3BD89E|nr:extracellular solute-binding protein [Paraburkholderia sp. DHOC27]RFU49102.1 extracellular solute-binding protein [Paraburkholderia sp. DHOC27]